uniref:Uncharacterized protein n=1 Tax=Arundo donax TaxID=35708 RepID=A0A0A9HNI5_ARUDO
MIEITCHTLIKENDDPASDFPVYAYNLIKEMLLRFTFIL